MTSLDPVAELPGLDLAALEAWLDVERPGLRVAPLTGTLLTGGKSNLTYRITDGMGVWALRRGPLGHALPTAHDMSREFRVISALRGTAVPVPEAMVLCDDPDVIGAPFYLMSFVGGVVLDQPEVLAALSAHTARTACEQLIDTLLALHAIDPASVGLGDFGRPEGFLARQLKRWTAQWEASQSEPRAGFAELVQRLTDSLPEQSTPGIVHGDYRLTNVMYTPTVDSIAAVLDWEMATVGDPLTDVGLLVVYQTLAANGGHVMPSMTVDHGFLSVDEMVARYASGSPRDLSHLAWYIGFAYFKLAVISEGIHYRFLQGKTVGDGFSGIGEWIPPLISGGHAALDRLPDASTQH